MTGRRRNAGVVDKLYVEHDIWILSSVTKKIFASI
jgi:hypothetical protein